MVRVPSQIAFGLKMKRVSPIVWLVSLIAVTFTCATALQPLTAQWNQRAQSGSILKTLLGDGKRIFANHFFVQADVSFHSGYYPTIFDQANKPKTAGMATEQGGHDEAEHVKQMDYFGKPQDWVDAFGRNFRITEHTHLKEGKEREILPWLKLSADLDPHRVQTYTVASFWLRTKLGKVREAEGFLREGLRNNPDSYEILLELGRLYHENVGDVTRARNVWELALNRWTSRNANVKEQDLFGRSEIAIYLARLEEEAGNLERAVALLKLAQAGSPHAESLQAQIEGIQSRIPQK
jgi:tetratricopeptide (TPR) repeat protein